jgi:hypothetical protein
LEINLKEEKLKNKNLLTQLSYLNKLNYNKNIAINKIEKELKILNDNF